MKRFFLCASIILAFASCKKENMSADLQSQAAWPKQSSEALKILEKVKANPDKYIYHSFSQEVQGRDGACQMVVVGMAVGPFVQSTTNLNMYYCQSMYGFYRFYSEGRNMSIPVKLTARKRSGQHPWVLFTAVRQASSLNSSEELGTVGVETPFAIPVNELVDYTVTPIPCGQGYQFSYVFTGN